MTTLKSSLNVRRTQPGWVFWVLWIAASELGGMLYFLPVGVVHIVLGLDRLDDPLRSGEITTWMLVLAAVLCGAACGSTIGLAQWLVLRRQFKRMGLWIAATVAGYASIGLLAPIVSVFQPGWLNWALTLIISGKMHWMARLQPSWPAASWEAGGITLTLFGLVLGIAQWLVLRRRVSQAGWWVAISAVGWALAAAMNFLPWETFVTAVFLVPPAIAGGGIVWLQRRSAPAMQASV